jgi:hypothetical protein
MRGRFFEYRQNTIFPTRETNRHILALMMILTENSAYSNFTEEERRGQSSL